MIIALAIPLFFLAIGVELLVARRRAAKVYRFADSITDLGCGIGSQVVGLFYKGALLALYAVVSTLAPVELSSSSILVWIGTFVAVDFAYYWWHRASHRINVLWGGHIVHHQSQDYNLAVALRQAWFTPIGSICFYLPLALLGVPVLVYATCDALNTLYQFWIHTRLIGKLGPLEWILNTPSHHRVHHGVNPRYIDKNYAGVFIVWDRLFGTFEEEREEPVYGTVIAYESWNSLWANFHYLVELGRRTSTTARWSDKLRVWVAPPEWAPTDLGGPKVIPEVDRGTYVPWDTPMPVGLPAYISVQFVPVAVTLVALLALADQTGLAPLVLPALLTLWSLANWGGLFEQRGWARASEHARLAGLVVITAATTAAQPALFAPLTAIALCFAVVSSVWFYRLPTLARS